MGKRALPPGQMAFAFEAPLVPASAGALAGDDVRVSMMVADILHGDSRPREVIAAEMSRLLGVEISKAMLDGYASPARDAWAISYTRLKALIAVTARHDLLDRDLRGIGASLLVGDEIMTARLGHLRARKSQIDSEIRALEGRVQPIERETMKRGNR